MTHLLWVTSGDTVIAPSFWLSKNCCPIRSYEVIKKKKNRKVDTHHNSHHGAPRRHGDRPAGGMRWRGWEEQETLSNFPKVATFRVAQGRHVPRSAPHLALPSCSSKLDNDRALLPYQLWIPELASLREATDYLEPSHLSSILQPTDR